jgi:hypothetical protein
MIFRVNLETVDMLSDYQPYSRTAGTAFKTFRSTLLPDYLNVNHIYKHGDIINIGGQAAQYLLNNFTTGEFKCLDYIPSPFSDFSPSLPSEFTGTISTLTLGDGYADITLSGSSLPPGTIHITSNGKDSGNEGMLNIYISDFSQLDGIAENIGIDITLTGIFDIGYTGVIVLSTGFPEVSGFTVVQNDSNDYTYNWDVTPTYVIYIENSENNVDWFLLDFEDPLSAGPLLNSYTDPATTFLSSFIPGNTYYFRARYQDVFPDPTQTGPWTVVSFVAF